jgi:hypothetical protein
MAGVTVQGGRRVSLISRPSPFLGAKTFMPGTMPGMKKAEALFRSGYQRPNNPKEPKPLRFGRWPKLSHVV